METTILGRYLSKVKISVLPLACGILLFGRVDCTFAVTKTTIATGLQAAVGVALDEEHNHLYFVEYGAGTLKRLGLSSPSHDLIARDLSHPEDVQLDLAHGLAYVTTRDAPGTGGLWKIDISTGSKSLVTFNLGAPQQLVLDIPNNQAFTVGHKDGRLRRINLTTGAKTPIFKELGKPVGLAITKDKKYAYVTEQKAPAQISKIDLTMGVKVGEYVVRNGVGGVSLVAPFFLAWTDNSQNSLYVVERDPANKVSRVDLITSTKNDAVTEVVPPPPWWWRPSGIVVSSANTPAYVATDKAIVKVDMGLDISEPGFMGVGHVPISKIDSGGYATTDPGYFFQVKNAPFGGTLNIFGNLSDFKGLGATYYGVRLSKDGVDLGALNLSWNAYKWDPALSEYKLVSVAPLPDTTMYLIPAEYPANPEWWYPSFLIMRWPSGQNGLYRFTLVLYDGSGTDITPSGLKELTVLIDNTPPVVNIHNIFQNKPPITDIEPCVIVDSGWNKFTFKITANDAEGHLYNYALSALYGYHQHLAITSDSYENHIGLPPPPYVPVLWSGIVNGIVPASPISVPCNCAYTFYLRAWGRTINGYNRIQYVDYHKSITVDLPSLSPCTKP